MEMTQQCYDAEFNVTGAGNHCFIASDTSPMVLNSVLSPISELASSYTSSPVHSAKCKQFLECAPQKRDCALSLARLDRNMAKTRQAQKRILKADLENEVELVGNFWRNKLAEGSTRSGKIPRVAPIRK